MNIENLVTARIKQLPDDLASKIAAGEVVERPASVLKELLENSIDAGATQIDITIENGGIDLIKVRDNGYGIVREDLQLALQQHATSKIQTAGDLTSIMSLGFRGEALASINSVSKLNITSHTSSQDHAWCINQNKIVAAAHPVGTTVIMQDLFYNLPARRKFLRSPRTEYQYLEETFKRIALSNFDVGFSLTNNNKLVKSLPICKDRNACTRRLINLCGQQVLKDALTIDCEQNGLRLSGWLGSPHSARSTEPHQYFFINQRVIRDRLINHAIRAAYAPYCNDGSMPFYCLYLELDPVALDVNVHPTKHEVRFREARVVHAFLQDVITSALEQYASERDVSDAARVLSLQPDVPIFATQKWGAPTSASPVQHESPTSEQNIAKILTILPHQVVVAEQEQQLLLIDLIALRKYLLLQDLQKNTGCFDLMVPQTISIANVNDINEQFISWCAQLGIKIECLGPTSVVLRALPSALTTAQINFHSLIANLHYFQKKSGTIADGHAAIITSVEYQTLPDVQIQSVLAQLSQVPATGIWRKLDYAQLQQLCI